MLYPTINQPTVFILIFLTGFAAGFIFDVAYFLSAIFFRNKIITQILLAISTILAMLLMFVVNLTTNYGQFRIFIVTAFLLAFTIERWTIGAFANKAYQRLCQQKPKKQKIKHKKIKTKKS